MKRFQGKTVLITGASSGLGAEFARRLAESGANLLLTARSRDKLDALAKSLAEKHKGEARVFVADLGAPQGPRELFDEIAGAGIDVDIVINNAGFGKWGHFESFDRATYESMCNLNMNAVVALTRLFLPGMLARKAGGFLNVASTAAFQSVPYFAVYSATKAFVLSFSEALSEEYRDRGIQITCLCPGATETNFHRVSQVDRKKLSKMESAEKVVRAGLRAFLAGRPAVISGAMNYILANSSRLMPRAVVSKVTARMFRP